MAIRDLRGEKYGLLTCIEPTGEKGRDGTAVWRCRCECGSECFATSAQLGRGEKKSCGCLQRMPRPIHVGQRFGALTVTADAGSGTGRQLWRCKCDCGNECVVPASQLNRGKKKSCGCLSPQTRDLLDQRFGALTVTGYAGKRGRSHFWQCQCDCGRQTEVSQNNLVTGHTKSCGCLQRQSRVNNSRQDSPAAL